MHFKLLRYVFAPSDGGGGGDPAAAAAPAPAPAPSATVMAGGDPAPSPAAAAAPASGDPAPSSWDATLPPELRTLVTAKGWKSPADALTSYAHLEGTVGRDKIALPGKDAKPEDWDKVYTTLGRPESPDKYDLGDFKPPEGVPWDGAAQTAMLAEMHAAGLNSAQVQRLMKKYGDVQGGSFQAMQTNSAAFVEASTAQLRTDWGAKYDANMDLANRAVKHAFGDDLGAVKQMRLADGTFVLDNPALAKAFARVGASWSEDSDLPGGKGGGPAFAGTPVAAKAELDKLMLDQSFRKALLDPNHAEHRQAVDRRRTLYAVAFPEQRKA